MPYSSHHDYDHKFRGGYYLINQRDDADDDDQGDANE